MTLRKTLLFLVVASIATYSTALFSVNDTAFNELQLDFSALEKIERINILPDKNLAIWVESPSAKRKIAIKNSLNDFSLLDEVKDAFSIQLNASIFSSPLKVGWASRPKKKAPVLFKVSIEINLGGSRGAVSFLMRTKKGIATKQSARFYQVTFVHPDKSGGSFVWGEPDPQILKDSIRSAIVVASEVINKDFKNELTVSDPANIVKFPNVWGEYGYSATGPVLYKKNDYTVFTGNRYRKKGVGIYAVNNRLIY